jgi:cytochrome b561
VFLVLLRIVWGFAGTRWSRFASLDLRPASLRRYLTAVVSGDSGMERAGHNPATGWFMTLMLPLLLALGATGIFTAAGGERLEELHQALAWTAMALVVVHLLGVAWHVARTGENLVASMVTGRRRGVPDAGRVAERPVVALMLLLFTAAFAVLLSSRLDVPGRRLALFGTTLTIGEAQEPTARTATPAAVETGDERATGEAEEEDDDD